MLVAMKRERMVRSGRLGRPAGTGGQVGTPPPSSSRSGTHPADDMAQAFRDAIRTGTPADLRRAQAAEQLLSRVFGKPKETVETPKPELPEDVAAIRAMPLEEKLALLATLGPIELASN